MLEKRRKHLFSYAIVLASITVVAILFIINDVNAKGRFDTLVLGEFKQASFDTAIVYVEDPLMLKDYEKLTCIVDEYKKVNEIVNSFKNIELVKCRQFDISNEKLIVTLYEDKNNYVLIHLCEDKVFFSIYASGKKKDEYYHISNGSVDLENMKKVLEPRNN